MKIRKLQTKVLLTGILILFMFSIFMGIIAGARGLGSLYPQLNLSAKPFVCPNSQMSYEQHVTEIGSSTYWSASWFCVDEQSGVKRELNPTTVFLLASPLYILVLFALLMLGTYLYWYSSVGPAKNDGLHLW